MLLDQGVSQQKKSELHLGRFVLDYSDKALVMGILNRTPDSFYDGGKYKTKSCAVDAAYRMVHEGADIIDIGGQSTRPGSNPVITEEELERIIPIIEEIAGKIDVPISVDTSNHAVAEESLKRGAVLINDITGLKGDEKMAGVVSKYGAGVVLMHIKGTPKDMQNDPAYDNLIEEIISYLRDSVQIGINAGIPHEKMIIDPGIGFGKAEEHNLSIINRLSEFKQLGKPILIGVSRKSFIGSTLKLAVDERVFGTAACVALSIANGANIVRVHDVKQMKEIARMTDAIAREGRL
ncbi:MAG: dihydropteroate synthase [Candidatus Omnitrophica bacterium]|nr:dihydropteroate synthase [Candidatus Omnitrophota bacterium]